MQAHINGNNVFYTTNGQGYPMLLMHGGSGLDHTYFRPWLDPLSDTAQLIYYDQLGNGRSSRPQSYEGIGLDTWADEADALRAALGHERIILLGHSYGGFIAQEYALRHGDHLAGLILSNTAPALDYPEVVAANAMTYGTPEQAQIALGGLSDPSAVPDDEAWREIWTKILPMYFHNYDPEIARAMDEATQYSVGAFAHGFAVLGSFNTLNRLGEISVPTLIISSRYDWITPPQQGGERLHTAIPNSELVVFENSGHFPFIEEQDAFLSTVRNWLTHLI
jgi:proline iminopeptidase